MSHNAKLAINLIYIFFFFEVVEKLPTTEFIKKKNIYIEGGN